jgi:hypothetical protein
MNAARALTFVLVLAAGGGAAAQMPLKERPVPGWPGLQIETRYVARVAMRGYCLGAPAGMPIPDTPLDSCARPDFWRGVCDIFIDARHAGNAALHEREVKRCRGHDYQGSDQFAEAWRAWREHGENRYALMLDFDSMMFVIEPPGNCAADDKTCIEAP